MTPGRAPGPSPAALLRLAPTLARTPYLTFPALHRRYGPVVRMGLVRPLRFHLLLGRDANQLILADRPEAFRWRDATKALIPVDGETALVVTDGDDHRRRRRLVQPAFAKRRIDGYLPAVLEEIDRTLDGWPTAGTLDAHAELRRTIRRIVIRSLFGDRLGGRADEVGDALERVLAYVNRPPGLRFDHEVPGSAYAKAMRDKRRADAIVFAEIAARRADGHDRGDVLSALLAAGDDEGGPGLADDEVRDQVLSLVAAGYDTTSAGAAWAVHALWSRPEVLARARAEVLGVAGRRPPTVDDLAAMPYLEGVVAEALRLWPPGPLSGRRVIEPVELAGVAVPVGDLIIYSAYLTHRLPELWPEPERFEPGRWVAGDPAHHDVPPYAYVPFGGGYRRCIGFALATMEMKAILARLLQRVELVVDPEPLVPTGIATMAPKGGVPVAVAARHCS